MKHDDLRTFDDECDSPQSSKFRWTRLNLSVLC
jgi:hypothetical protein